MQLAEKIVARTNHLQGKSSLKALVTTRLSPIFLAGWNSGFYAKYADVLKADKFGAYGLRHKA